MWAAGGDVCGRLAVVGVGGWLVLIGVRPGHHDAQPDRTGYVTVMPHWTVWEAGSDLSGRLPVVCMGGRQ